MLSVAACCCGEVGCLSCSPCQIPRKDLKVSFHHIIFGDQTGTIVYDGHFTWGATITFGSPPTGLTIVFQCSSGGFFLRLTGGLDCQYPWFDATKALFLAAYTCNPFHAEFTFHNAVPLTDCVSQYSGSFVIDDPGPATPCPGYTTFIGCNSLPLASVPIQFYDHSGGTLLFTVTTDGNGQFLVPPGTYWITEGSGRFGGMTQTIGLTGGPIGFPLAAGYPSCVKGCVYPAAATWHIIGDFTTTISWDGFSWAGAVGIFGTMDCTSTGGNTCEATLVSCPPSLLIDVVIHVPGNPDEHLSATE